MRKDTVIVIPTLGRDGRPRKQYTWDKLPEQLRASAVLLCSKQEAPALRDVAGKAHVVVSDAQSKGKGFTAACNDALSWARSNSAKRLFLLDDDLYYWGIKRADDETRVVVATAGQVVEHFGYCEKLMDLYAHGGIGQKLFSNTKGIVEHNSRVLRAKFYRVDVLHKQGIKFDEKKFPCMQDMALTLSLFKAGYANAVYYGLVQEQPGSNNAGGCSNYRTAKLLEQCANQMVKEFSPFVRTRQKVLKHAWGDMGNVLVDVTVQWGRLAEHYHAFKLLNGKEMAR